MGAGSPLDDSQIQVSLAAVNVLTAYWMYSNSLLTVYGLCMDHMLTVH